MPKDKLYIASIFQSLEGECTGDGPLQWTIFVRLGGCNLRCYQDSGGCDTPQALEVNDELYTPYTIAEVIDEVVSFKPCNRVTITGGEPLTQLEGVVELASELRNYGYSVNMETNGSLDLKPQFMRHFNTIIMDAKTPSTLMHQCNVPVNMNMLRSQDYAKFVIQDYEDYTWAIRYLEAHRTNAKVAFGVRWNHLDPRKLISWLVQDKQYNIRINLQLHKMIWEDELGVER